MVTVYRLRNDARHIKSVQEATLGSDAFGIQQTHGLFGSDAWWQQIAAGRLPLQTARGQITRVYMGSMGDWPVFVMRCSDGSERSETRWMDIPEMDTLYQVGASIEVDYVVQHLKSGAATDCVIEIRIRSGE